MLQRIHGVTRHNAPIVARTTTCHCQRGLPARVHWIYISKRTRLSQLADPPGLLLLTIPLCCNLFALQVRKTVMLPLLDSLLAWAAHSEHQEVWAGPSWSSIALRVRSLLLPGV
jgi:hypothetical protein